MSTVPEGDIRSELDAQVSENAKLATDKARLQADNKEYVFRMASGDQAVD